jgi:acyl-[acyl-carrier-protein]-phospholipid O-acyltransferase / long-chain-fatty-acid--[acyl-carrier-protein] ligase
MQASADESHTSPLDDLPSLPVANKRSLILVLLVQALNSFSDNLVKMLIIVFAHAVAKGEPLGERMQTYLGLTFLLPYIIFAPVAGWVSDRFSKQRVMLWMQAIQVIIFLAFIGCLSLGNTTLVLRMCLVTFFVLATQAAFFAPAKMGILKELAGSRRLGLYSGLQQMTMFAAILLGMGLAGIWFSKQLDSGHTPWQAVMTPLYVVTGLAILQTFGGWWIAKTPDHSEMVWKNDVWWEHVGNMRLLFSKRAIACAAAGIGFFWFIANGVGTILVGLGNEFFATASESSAFNSKVSGTLGAGIMLGSLAVGVMCRRRIELGIVPIASAGLAVALMIGSQIPPSNGWIFVAMLLTGAFAGMFMVPLYSFVQDRCVPSERARVLAGVGFVDSLAGSIANLCVLSMLAIKLPSALQLLIIGILTVFAFIAAIRIIPADFIRLLCTSFLRLIYRIKIVGGDRMPREGGVLLLANHMTYMDAGLLATASDRPLRFVIWDEWYAEPKLQGFLKLFDTIPISPKRAKDAIRTVSEALKAGDCVCLFPEGQITRVGMLNEVRKGYELMARLANASVVTAYMDGLWGSVFSFSGGKFLGKWPKAFRYPVAIHFDHAMPAKEATAEAVRASFLKLSNEAFLAQRRFRGVANSVPLANALRLAHTQLFVANSLVLCLEPADSAMAQTLALIPGVSVVYDFASVSSPCIAVGSPSSLNTASHSPQWAVKVDRVLRWQTATEPPIETLADKPVFTGWWDTATNAILAQSVPDIAMGASDEEPQRGHLPGSLGRLVIGLRAEQSAQGLMLSGIAPGQGDSVQLQGGTLDMAGFVWPSSRTS